MVRAMLVTKMLVIGLVDIGWSYYRVFSGACLVKAIPGSFTTTE